MNESNPDIIDISPDAVVDHDVDSNPATAPTPSPRRPMWPRVVLGAALVAFSAVGGGWIYRDYLSSYLPSDAVKLLNQRVDALDASNKEFSIKLQAVVGVTDEIKSQADAAQSAVAQLGIQIVGMKEGAAASTKSLAGIESSLSEVKSHIADLQASLQAGTVAGAATAAPEVEQRLAVLEKDLGTLKVASNSGADKSMLSQGLADLKGKVDSGAPFADEYERIRRMVPAADGLDVLAKFAEDGVATPKDLERQLKLAANQLPHNEATVPAKDTSWSGWALDALSGLVSVRDQATPDWQVFLQKAETAINAGDLTQAAAVFENLPVALPEALKTWHDDANSRLQLDAAMAKVSGAVLRQIAAKG